jgi:hypothetical protein
MEQSSNNAPKIITGIVVLAAVAMIYFFTMGRPHSTSASSTVNDTPLSSASQPNTSSRLSGSPTYKAGTYTATGSYRTPESFESITVSLAVAGDGTITDSSVQQTASNSESEQYQAAFRNNYKQYVVGKKLSDVNLGYVSGSSLTSNGFDEALGQIQSQAKQS